MSVNNDGLLPGLKAMLERIKARIAEEMERGSNDGSGAADGALALIRIAPGVVVLDARGAKDLPPRVVGEALRSLAEKIAAALLYGQGEMAGAVGGVEVGEVRVMAPENGDCDCPLCTLRRKLGAAKAAPDSKPQPVPPGSTREWSVMEMEGIQRLHAAAEHLGIDGLVNDEATLFGAIASHLEGQNAEASRRPVYAALSALAAKAPSELGSEVLCELLRMEEVKARGGHPF